MSKNPGMTSARRAALEKVAAGSVEYEGASATYWVDGQPARGWRFRTLSELVRAHLIQRPDTPRRALVTLTENGRSALREPGGGTGPETTS